MATTDETNTKQLPSFSTLKPFEQMAIVLRAEGKTAEQTVNQINAEYDLSYKRLTINQWFIAGGRLEQAYNEYNESLADQLVAEAKLKIKKLSATAAYTLEELMSPSNAGNVRQQAAKTILGKYIPDRQILIDERNLDDIPDEIGDAGDKVISGEPDGQGQMDDPSKGEAPTGSDGAGGNEAVPPSVLPQPAATD